MSREFEQIDGAGIAIFNETEGILLVQSRKDPNNWSIPKGHIKQNDEDLLRTAIREVYEETGLTNQIDYQIMETIEPILSAYEKESKPKRVVYFIANANQHIFDRLLNSFKELTPRMQKKLRKEVLLIGCSGSIDNYTKETTGTGVEGKQLYLSNDAVAKTFYDPAKEELITMASIISLYESTKEAIVLAYEKKITTYIK